MKSILAEKLIEICGTDNDHGYGIDNLTARQLKAVESVLIKYLKFDRIEWVDLPRVVSLPNGPMACHTMKLADNNPPTYENKIGYIYKVMFSPVMYDPTEYVKPVKNGCSMTPVVYDPTNFEPRKHIMLSWSPGDNSDKQMKFELMDKLFDVLENPEEYMQTGYRAAMIRFATVDNGTFHYNGTAVCSTNGTGTSKATPTI
jgi:hypothetical protein